MLTLILSGFIIVIVTYCNIRFLSFFLLKVFKLNLEPFETLIIWFSLLVSITYYFVYFNFDLIYLIVLILILSFLSLFINLNHFKFNFEVLFIILFVLFICSLIFGINLIDISFPNRIGPDGFGYLITANYLNNIGNYQEISQYVEKLFSSNDIESMFKPSNISVLNFGFLSKSIASEFLIGANRLVIPGLISLLAKSFPFLTIFEIGSLFISINLLLTIYISHKIINKFKINIWISFILSFIFTFNLLIISLTFDGGINQFVTNLSLFYFIYLLFNLNFSSLKNLILLTSFFNVSLLFYPDSFTYILLIIFIFLITKFFYKGKDIFKTLITIFSSFIFFTIINFIWVSKFISWVFRRIQDASQGGWPQVHTLTLADYFGITNIFTNFSLQTTLRLNFDLFFSLLINLLIIFLVIFVYYYKSDLVELKFFTYFLLFSLLIISYLIVFFNFSTYAQLKIGATLGPIIFTLIFMILNKSKLKSTYYLTLALLVVLIYLFNFYTFISQSVQNDKYTDKIFSNSFEIEKLNKLIMENNIILGDGLGKFDSFNYMISSFSDFYNINSNTQFYELTNLNQFANRSILPLLIVTNPNDSSPDTFYNILNNCNFEKKYSHPNFVIFKFSTESSFLNNKLRINLLQDLKDLLRLQCNLN